MAALCGDRAVAEFGGSPGCGRNFRRNAGLSTGIPPLLLDHLQKKLRQSPEITKSCKYHRLNGSSRLSCFRQLKPRSIPQRLQIRLHPDCVARRMQSNMIRIAEQQKRHPVVALATRRKPASDGGLPLSTAKVARSILSMAAHRAARAAASGGGGPITPVRGTPQA